MSENKGRTGAGAPADNDDDNYLTLEFEDGKEIECEIMGVFEVEGKEYIALLPNDGSEDIYLYGYREVNEDEFEMLDIEDDGEFEKVAAEFDRLMSEDVVDLEEE
ncbi:MAG: DUF1292 domain-containing protein [Firmicutes bacterium]|nr:DUF1292 domain-containing protein [Bacillota bacterium]MBR2576539.1 DUF1292 domain-containing protein [Bacillota bacterium]